MKLKDVLKSLPKRLLEQDDNDPVVQMLKYGAGGPPKAKTAADNSKHFSSPEKHASKVQPQTTPGDVNKQVVLNHLKKQKWRFGKELLSYQEALNAAKQNPYYVLYADFTIKGINFSAFMSANHVPSLEQDTDKLGFHDGCHLYLTQDDSFQKIHIDNPTKGSSPEKHTQKPQQPKAPPGGWKKDPAIDRYNQGSNQTSSKPSSKSVLTQQEKDDIDVALTVYAPTMLNAQILGKLKDNDFDVSALKTNEQRSLRLALIAAYTYWEDVGKDPQGAQEYRNIIYKLFPL